MPSFKNFGKKLEGATRGQSFVWEVYGIFWSNLQPLVFDQLTFILYCSFFTAVASGRYLYKSTIFSDKGCFWLLKIAKNNKTLQREYNHCMDCCKHGPAMSRLIKITFQSGPILHTTIACVLQWSLCHSWWCTTLNWFVPVTTWILRYTDL